MPTGVALTDARSRLFDAAERLLLDGGPAAATSRSVTIGAGVAKGVLHRHFGDFDTFLSEFALDRLRFLDEAGAHLRAQAGTGDVVENVVAGLAALNPPVVLALARLTIARDDLRERLRTATGTVGIPMFSLAGQHLAGYLTAEQAVGRLSRDADAAALAGALLASASMLLDTPHGPGRTAEVRRTVAAVLSGLLPGTPRRERLAVPASPDPI